MKARLLFLICLAWGFTVVVTGQTKKATTEDGKKVILKSDGTWSYEKPDPAPTANLVTFTGKCRFQIVAGFFPCNPKVIYLQKPDYSHLAFVVNDKGKEIIFSLSGRSEGQPNLQNYYLQIDTVSIDGVDNGASDNGMEGECHFRMNKSATTFFFVKCDIYNRAKGTLYNFYLEKITKTQREIVK